MALLKKQDYRRIQSPFVIKLKLLLISFFFLHALCAEEEIRVELVTQTPLSSFYLYPIETQDAHAVEPLYLRALYKVLEFDLNYSGYCKAIKKGPPLEKLSISSFPEQCSKIGASVVIRALIHENKMDVYLFTAKSASLKQFQGIPLTFKIEQDRHQMHKLAGAIIESAFDKPAITNSRILYSLQTGHIRNQNRQWKSEIWECDWDGGNPKQITFEQNYLIHPIFNPSIPGADTYFVVSYKNGQPKIHLASCKTGHLQPFLHLRGNQLLPAISKQGDQLAFISDASGRADLFIQPLQNQALKGKPIQLFSFPGATQASPSFSPDGKQLAFVSDKDGTPRIYLIPSSLQNGKRAHPILITKINRENTCPNWSPDGTKIAYSAKTNGVRQIWIYDCITQEERQLTVGAGNKENPCWAQNSLHLIFNSTDPDSSELYLVNLNQPEAIKITQGPGKKHYPAWGGR